MLTTIKPRPTATAEAPAGALRVALASDGADALQACRLGVAAEGIAVERLPPSRPGVQQRPADVYVLHLQTALGCQLPGLRELRDRVPLSPLMLGARPCAIWIMCWRWSWAPTMCSMPPPAPW